MKSLRPVEVGVIVVVLAIGVAILVLGIRSTRGSRDQTECFYNLRSLHVGYESSMGNYSRFVTEISTNAGGTREYADQGGAAYLHFRALVSAYFTPASPDYPPIHNLICPLDERVAAPLGSVFNTNISYFLSLNPPAGNGKWVLAGNRNVSFGAEPKPGTQPTRKVTWNPAIGLHGDSGYLLLLDGSVTRVGNADLQKFFNEAGNSTNRLAIP